jgi:transcriptional regulator with XRE-family HTH domain
MKSNIDIGPKIREIRLKKGLRLKDVAKETGLSVSLISKVENNNTSPSLSTLIKLSNFLGMDTGYVLGESENKKRSVVCHKEERKTWNSDDYKIHFELLNPSLRSKRFEVVHARLGHFETPTEKYTHEGDEFGLVMKGEIKVELGDEVHLLKEGDSIYFRSSVPHAIYGVDPEGSEILWVNCPPIKIL